MNYTNMIDTLLAIILPTNYQTFTVTDIVTFTGVILLFSVALDYFFRTRVGKVSLKKIEWLF